MLILTGPAGEPSIMLPGLISMSTRFVATRTDAGLPSSLCSEMGAITASLAWRKSDGIGVRRGAASRDFRSELRRGGGVFAYCAGSPVEPRDPTSGSLGAGGIALTASVDSAGTEACDTIFGCATSALLRADALVARDEIESQRRPSLGKLANRDDSCISLLSFAEKILVPVPKDEDLELPDRPRRWREPTLEWYEYLRELGGYRLSLLDTIASETGGAGSGRPSSTEYIRTLGNAFSREKVADAALACPRSPTGNGVGSGKVVSLSEVRNQGKRKILLRLDVDEEDRKREWPKSKD